MGNRLADLIGPFYDTEGVSTLLDITEPAVTNLRDSGELLGMQTNDDAWVYPTFQFTGHHVNPTLLPALRVLHGQPGWSIGIWCVTPDEYLDGLTAIEWAEAGNPPADLVTSARRTAARWKGASRS